MRQMLMTSPWIERVTGGFVAAAMVAAMLLATPSSPALASPAAPAHAATAQTVSFTAHAATSGKISPFSNPLDITCTFTVDVPKPQGSTLADSYVRGSASTICRYDIDGSSANVAIIDMNEQLLSDGALVKTDHERTISDSREFTVVPSFPCRHGNWTNSAQVAITFPLGYSPANASTWGTTQTFLGLGDCPGDRVEVPDVTGDSVSIATAELQAAGLVAGGIGSTVSCDVPKNTIASTDPPAGPLVLLGSTVTMRKSVGPPATPCP